MRRLLLVAPLALAPLACVENPTPDVEPEDQRAELPPAPLPEEGFQVVGPDIVIPAGEDKMFCWVPDISFTEDRLVKKFETYQGPLGHHLFGMKSAIPRQPGEMFDCSTVDQMSTLEPMISPTTANKEGAGELLSDDFAVRIPAGAQIIMQSHYVNITDHDIVIRDGGNFLYLGADEERIEASYIVLNDSNLDIPPTNEHFTHTTECTIPHDLQIASVMGHMHEWGKAITIEHENADGVTEVYSVDQWTAAYRDAAPITRYPLDEPLTFAAGDTLRVTCDWVNDTGDSLRFPDEMCVSLMVYYPALPDGFIVCD
jgi:hypothetical protein